MTENVENDIRQLKAVDLKRKTKVTGKVVKTTLAGAFVDISMDMPGIIHISQLKKGPVKSVDEVVKIGQEVTAWVRRVNRKNEFVELTLIEPLDLEWRDIKNGMTVKGQVIRIENYGVLVDIGAARPALIHISELTHDYIRSPKDIINVGDEVEAKVIKVNRNSKQIRLSLKALQEKPSPPPKPETEKEEEAPVPTAMEIALRKAMVSSQEDEATSKRSKQQSKGSRTEAELEDILDRTLENRVKSTSG
ncbi:MAG: S1 RNA-binding domain-containing protein [Chloroflexota bacterium]